MHGIDPDRNRLSCELLERANCLHRCLVGVRECEYFGAQVASIPHGLQGSDQRFDLQMTKTHGVSIAVGKMNMTDR